MEPTGVDDILVIVRAVSALLAIALALALVTALGPVDDEELEGAADDDGPGEYDDDALDAALGAPQEAAPLAGVVAGAQKVEPWTAPPLPTAAPQAMPTRVPPPVEAPPTEAPAAAAPAAPAPAAPAPAAPPPAAVEPAPEAQPAAEPPVPEQPTEPGAQPLPDRRIAGSAISGLVSRRPKPPQT